VTQISTSDAETLSQRGLDLLAAGSPAEAAQAFRAAIAADPAHFEAHHGLIRALRDAGRLEQSVAAALALTALTPADPLAHAALSISLQHAGHVPEAEAAAARARVLEWKIQLQSPPQEDSLP
jgi:tetratricopeptide (TPR) repeat protein